MLQSKKTYIWSFYCFTKIPSPDFLVPKLLLTCKKKMLKGTILLANEGFNGSIAGEEQNVKILFNQLVSLTNAKKVNLKTHHCSFIPFNKLKIKIKKEIVRFDIALDVENLKGQYVKPKDWDNFINDEKVILIDVRNDYEVQMGSFKGAINPKTDTFRQFANWLKTNLDSLKNKKVGMFCTGGIRCEKSTAYLKALGHQEVYHLEGGILQYLEETNASNWHGECFVFDDRHSLDNNLNCKK